MLEVQLVDAEEHSSHISQQDVHQFIEFEWNLLRRLHFLPVLLTDTRFALVLTQEHSVGQRQHVMVDERFQTQTWRFVSVLGGCNFDQGLQEVLKVHVGFVAVNRAENQVQAFFHLFVSSRAGLIRVGTLLVDACISHDLVVLLGLDGVYSHPVVHERVLVEQSSEQFASIEDVLLGFFWADQFLD